MESLTAEAIGALAAFGPEWGFLAVTIIALGIVIIKGLPAFKEIQQARLEIQRDEANARIELDRRREERKEAEEQSRERRDRERSEMEGRWAAQNDRAINAQEQANAAMESVSKQLEIMNTQLADSKGNSLRIGATLGEISDKVGEIHRVVVK